MKKTRLLVALLLIAALALSLAACGSKKTPATAEQFQNEMKERGYEEIEIDMSTTDAQTRAAVEQVKAAVKMDGDNPSCVVRFYVAKSETNAQQLFAGTKPLAEETAAGTKTQVETNLGNHSYYRVKGDSMICVLARIDNTLLYLQADNALEDEVDDIVKTLGYK